MADVVNDRVVKLLLMVVLAVGDCPTPLAEAVAMLVMETAVISFCVIAYKLGAVQVTVAPGTRAVFAGPQLNGAVPNRLSLTVNWVGPRFPAPVF